MTRRFRAPGASLIRAARRPRCRRGSASMEDWRGNDGPEIRRPGRRPGRPGYADRSRSASIRSLRHNPGERRRRRGGLPDRVHVEPVDLDLDSPPRGLRSDRERNGQGLADQAHQVDSRLSKTSPAPPIEDTKKPPSKGKTGHEKPFEPGRIDPASNPVPMFTAPVRPERWVQVDGADIAARSHERSSDRSRSTGRRKAPRDDVP